MSHQQPVLEPTAPQSCSCPPRGPQTCPAQPQLCRRANHGHRLNTVTVRRQLQPGKDGARGTGALCCAGSPGKPCCLRGWHRPRSHELLRGDVFSVGQESTPDVSHESDGKGGSRSHLSPAAASSPSPARVEKHTALAQHTPAGTLSSGRAPSRASQRGNTHVSLFWPNQFRKEAEATQTSLALLLCSPLIIAPLLLVACVKAWSLLQPLVGPPPARDGQREKEGTRPRIFSPLAGATGLMPQQSTLLLCVQGRAAPSTGYGPCMGISPQPMGGRGSNSNLLAWEHFSHARALGRAEESRHTQLHS